MPFQLSSGLAAPFPRPHYSAPLRALAWVLRRLMVGVAIVAVWQRQLLRRIHRVPWKLEGSCQSCGTCCENLLLPLGKNPQRWAWLRRYWHEVVFDFFPRGFQIDDVGEKGRGEEHSGATLASYGCRNFTVDRKCSRHSLRPFLCRAYPALALLDAPAPKDHCGYKLVQLPSWQNRTR